MQLGDDARRHVEHADVVGDVLDEDGELVAAQPRGRVGGPQAALQPLADRHEQLVAGGVAQAVVHRLEVVEVDEQHRHRRTLARRSGQGVLDPVAEQRLVGQVGQRVVERLVGELLLEPLLLGDVPEAPDPPDGATADPLRCGVALEHATVEERQLVLAVGVGLGVELLDLGDERVRLGDLREHVSERLLVVAGGEDVLGDVPQLDEAPVVAGDGAFAVDHEDPVGGGVESGVEERHRPPQVELGLLALGDVLQRAGEHQRGAVDERRDRGPPLQPADRCRRRRVMRKSEANAW